MYSLIIVDYCSIDKTVAYIKNFLDNVTEKEKYHVVIVDNAESDNAVEILKKKFNLKKIVKLNQINNDIYIFDFMDTVIIYCKSGGNVGYARGNNLGTLIADELFGDEYYIISNNDLAFNSVFEMKKFLHIFDSDSHIAVIGPKIIGLDGKTQSPHKKIGPIKHLIFNYWFRSWPFYWKCDHDYTGKSKKCYRVMGSFMVIRADAFQKAGRFDANTFMFAEEMILSERLEKIGFYCYFYDDYTVIHEHGTTVKKKASAVRAEKWAFDSCCYYYEKYRKTNKVILKWAKINFKIFLLYFSIILYWKKRKQNKE